MASPLGVLVTSAGAGPAIAIIKSLRRQKKLKVKVVAADTSSWAAGLYLADRHQIIPPVRDSRFIPTILNLCRREKIKFIIPILDIETPVFARARHLFRKEGVEILSNSEEVLESCIHKHKTYKKAHWFGIATPKLYSLKQIRFPLVLKPDVGVGARNVRRIQNRAEFKNELPLAKGTLIQEYIEGPEFTVDCLADAQGKLVAVVPRERLVVRDGQSVKSRTVKNPKLIRLCQKITDTFALRQSFCLQIKQRKGKFHLIEVNARYGTGVSLSIGAGVDIPLLQLKLALGKKISKSETAFKNHFYMLRYWEEIFIPENQLA